jgi:hypothetical protein
MFQIHLLESGNNLTWKEAIHQAWNNKEFIKNSRKIRYYPLLQGATPRMDFQ